MTEKMLEELFKNVTEETIENEDGSKECRVVYPNGSYSAYHYDKNGKFDYIASFCSPPKKKRKRAERRKEKRQREEECKEVNQVGLMMLEWGKELVKDDVRDIDDEKVRGIMKEVRRCLEIYEKALP